MIKQRLNAGPTEITKTVTQFARSGARAQRDHDVSPKHLKGTSMDEYRALIRVDEHAERQGWEQAHGGVSLLAQDNAAIVSRGNRFLRLCRKFGSAARSAWPRMVQRFLRRGDSAQRDVTENNPWPRMGWRFVD